MLYILDKHCTTCYCYSSHMVYKKKNNYPLFLKSWWGQKEEESPTTRFLRHLRLLRPARHGGLSHTNTIPRLASAHHIPREPQRRTTVLRHLWSVRSLDRLMQRWPNLLNFPSAPRPVSRLCTVRFQPDYTLFLYTAYIHLNLLYIP